MRFHYHPFTSIVIAAAVWLSLLPLRPMLQDHGYLVDAALVVGASAVIGALLALLRVPRGLTLLAQLLAVGAVVAWLGLGLTPSDQGPLAALGELTTLGMESVRTGVPPLEPHPGLTWLLILLSALLVIIVELLANGLEQPAWTVAPLGLPFGVAALVLLEDQSWTSVLPVVAGFLLIMVSTTGAPSDAVGKASNRTAFLASKVGVAAVIGAVAFGLALAVAPLIPLGEKQPWNQGGLDGPIELADPTVRLEEDLRRPADRPVLTYRTSNDQSVYLRTVALPSLTTGGARLLPMQLSRFGMDNAYSYPGDEVEVEVQMAEITSEYLPAPFAVDSVDADGNWSYDPDTMAVVASGQDRVQQTVGLGYSVTSTVPNATREEIAAAYAGEMPSDAVVKAIPEGLDPGVATLTRQVTATATTDGEKALALQEWFRSQAFEYTLNAPSTSSTDAISSFLLSDRAGYCIHFAAGMITMARLEGIPARMAIGYTPGQRQEDGSYEVTSHDAHAWPELYLDGLGWVPFEPTPPFPGPPGYTEPAEGDEAGATPSPSPTPSASPSPTAEQSPSPEPTQTAQPEITSSEGSGTAWLAWVLGALGALLLLALPALIRLAQRAVRLRSGQDAAALADGALREARAALRDFGIAWPSGSPGPAARAVAEDLPPRSAEALIQVAETVERSRFARDGAPVEALRDQVKAVRAGLSEAATPAGRARATFLPPSLVADRFSRG